MNRWLKGFVLEQKCMPWRVYRRYSNIRNLIFNINTQAHWDKVWSQERKYLPRNRLYPEAFGKIITMVPYGSKVMDIGCGIGILLERLKYEKNCDVFGIDISKEAIAAIKEKGIKGIVSKIPPINLPSNSFDIALATELLEHVFNPKTVLKEMIRVIKPKGLLIITVPDNALSPVGEREHVRIFSDIKLNNLLSQIKNIKNVEICRTKEKDENYYRLICKAEKCQI